MANLVLRTIKQTPLTIEELDQNFVNLNEQFTELNASNLITGTVPLNRIGLGSPNTTKFLRGDNTWQIVPIIPDQSDNEQKFLQTDGESLLWTPVIPSPILNGDEYNSSVGGVNNLVTPVEGEIERRGTLFISNSISVGTVFDVHTSDDDFNMSTNKKQGQINSVLEIGTRLEGSGVDAAGAFVVNNLPQVYSYDRLAGSETLLDEEIGFRTINVWPKNSTPGFNPNTLRLSTSSRSLRFIAQQGSTKINASLPSGTFTVSPTGIYGIFPEIGDKIISDAFPEDTVVVHAVYGQPDKIILSNPSTQSGVFFGIISSPHAAILSGSGNYSIGNSSLVVNGTNNYALGAKTTVLNGDGNVVNSPYSTIIAGSNNSISISGSLILSGGDNLIFNKQPNTTFQVGITPWINNWQSNGPNFGSFIGIGIQNSLGAQSVVFRGDNNTIDNQTEYNSVIVLKGSGNTLYGGVDIVIGNSNQIGNISTISALSNTYIGYGNNNTIQLDSPYTSSSEPYKNSIVYGTSNTITGKFNTITSGNFNAITGSSVELLNGHRNTITPFNAISRPIVFGALQSTITDGIAFPGWKMVCNTTNQRVEGIIPSDVNGWQAGSQPFSSYFGTQYHVDGGTQNSKYLQTTLTLTGKQTRKLSGYVPTNITNATDDTLKPGFIKIRPKTSYFITGKVICRRSTDGKTKAWDVKVLVARDTTVASARIVGTPTYTMFAQDSGTETWAITGAISTVLNDPVFTIQADRSSTANANTEKWLMSLEALEVALD
jgi:hypothetical protein